MHLGNAIQTQRSRSLHIGKTHDQQQSIYYFAVDSTLFKVNTGFLPVTRLSYAARCDHVMVKFRFWVGLYLKLPVLKLTVCFSKTSQ